MCALKRLKRRNTVDANFLDGIEINAPVSMNTIEDNTALSNGSGNVAAREADLIDRNGCPSPNTWKRNSFLISDPPAPRCIQ
jgi:parallel beta-helix repeat protein